MQATNDDAQLSKLCVGDCIRQVKRPLCAATSPARSPRRLPCSACVRLGYFNDDFVHLFVRRPARRAPLINRGETPAGSRAGRRWISALPPLPPPPPLFQPCRPRPPAHPAGYYSRYAALRTLLFQFLAAGADAPGGPPPKQVLSLGAGYDTAFFQMAKDGLASPGLTYVELDFPEVTRHKATAIARTPELLARLSPIADAGVDVDAEAGRVRSARYRLEPADLRQLDTVEAALQGAGLDPDLPTFVLAECVLVYMPPPASAAAVRWLGGRLRTAVFAAYEQVNPSDAFGRQMMVNLESRGVPLLGILPSLEAHVARFTGADWQRAEAKSMREIYAWVFGGRKRP